MMKRHLTMLVGCSASALVVLCSAPDVRAFDREFDESSIVGVSTVTEVSVTLSVIGTYRFWTEDLTSLGRGCDADTVMHVTGASSNDDCTISGLTSLRASCVEFANPSPRTVRVIVHAFATCSAARGSIRVTGPGVNQTFTNREFGGHILRTPTDDLGWGAGDRMHVVRPPQHLPASASYRAYALGTLPSSTAPFCPYNNVTLVARASTGRAGGVEAPLPTASSAFCRLSIVLGTTAGSVADRNARLYINDSPTDGINGFDADGDGLGNSLESALQTCSGLGSCEFSLNPMDTDRDGLRDDFEVLGSPTQALPRWGADPRHKDAFFEVDWNAAATYSWSPVGGDPLSASVIADLVHPFGQGDAASIDNPSGLPGVHVHLDTGADVCVAGTCCNASGQNCSTVYGDWDGANTTTENDYAIASKPPPVGQMAAERLGLFFYILRFHGGGASSMGNILGIGDAANLQDFVLGLAHEMGHCLGADHNGHPIDDPDWLECKPNYRSIMSYTFSSMPPPLFFSRGTQPDLVSTALNERKNPGLDLTWLQQYYGLLVDTANGFVDWNRNGVPDPANSQGDAIVSGITGYANNEICFPGRLHQNELDFGRLARGRRPAAAVLSGTLHAFFVQDSDRTLAHATYSNPLVPCTSDPNPPSDPDGTPDNCCPRATNFLNGPCNDWGSARSVTNQVRSSPAAVASVTTGGSSQITLVYARGAGTLRQFRIRRITSGTSQGLEQTLTVLQPLTAATDDPDPLVADASLAFEDPTNSGPLIHIYYLGTGNRVRRALVTDNGSTFTVSSDVALLDNNGNPLVSRFSPSALILSPFGPGPVSVTLGLVSNSGSSKLTEFFNGNASTTTFTRLVASSPRPIWSDGPLQLERSLELNPATGGQYEVFYPWLGHIRRVWSLVPPNYPAGLAFNLDRNITAPLWDLAGATLVMYQGHLQMLTVWPDHDGNTAEDQSLIVHQPFASGVFPFVEVDTDDYATFAERLCHHISARGDSACTLCSPPPPGVALGCLTATPARVDCY